MTNIVSTQKEQENAIVVAVCTKKGDAIKRKLDEITRLSISAGLNVVTDFYLIIHK